MAEQTSKRQIFRNRVVDKGQLKNLISWAFTNYGTARTAEMADRLKDLGFRYATRAGVSISVDDLQVPPIKRQMLEAAEDEIRQAEDRYTRGEITEVERFQKVIDTWNVTNDNLKDEVVRNFRENNPLNSVYMMAFSGARGNISQVRQLVGMRGLMANPQGEIIDLPIKTNFREGLTVTEYIISSYGARKGLVDTALRTADSGYLTRRLVDVSQDMIVREIDCGTTRGISLRSMTDGDRVLIKLKDRLLGRVLASTALHPETNQPVLHPTSQVHAPADGSITYSPELQSQMGSNTTSQTWSRLERDADLVFIAGDGNRQTLKVPKGYVLLVSDGAQVVTGQPVAAIASVRNQDISDEMATAIVKAGIEEVTVRSPLTCEATRSVCQLCYGWSLAHAHLVDMGEAVGIIAAQSIGEPGTQLTMRTFHTGGVFTGEIARQVRTPFPGVLHYQEVRSRPYRTRHGEEAQILEANAEVILRGEDGRQEEFSLVQGSILFAQDGEMLRSDQMIAEVPIAGRTRKTTEKATKDVATDLAGEVYFADIIPEEKKDRQGNTTRIAQRGGLIWVLSGEVYNLPPGARPVVKNGDHVERGSVLAETRLTTEHGGIVRLPQDQDGKGGREVEIITASVLLDQAKVRVESHQNRDHYVIETANNQLFSLIAPPGSKVTNGQVVAELIDDSYHTQTGGIIKFAGIEVAKRGKAKQGYEVVQGGTLLWIPEEAHEVNKDISLLLVEDGQYVEAGTEVVKDIFCQSTGIVEVVQKNDILREILIKPGDLRLVDNPNEVALMEPTLFNPGQEIIPGIVADTLSYVEYVETPEGSALLLRPVVEYAVPSEPSIPSQESTNESGRSIRLRAVQRLPYKDGERVKSVEGMELLRTQLILEIDKDAPQLAADIELVPDETSADQMRLQLVILESLVIRRDVAADQTQGGTHTQLLVQDGDQILPGSVVARTEIQCKSGGVVRGLPSDRDDETVRRLLVTTSTDHFTVSTQGQRPTVRVGDLLVEGRDSVAPGVTIPHSGEVVQVLDSEVVLRLARPYRVSNGAVLQVDNGDLVQRGDNLVLLVFERAKTGDIIQGLPRIEELLEARKPKEACVLASRPGIAQVVYGDDDTVEVKVIESDGVITEYPIGPGQNVIVIDGQEVGAAERLTDGPANPHDILSVFFQYYRESMGVHDAALRSFQEVQTFLVNEVQSVYQSQGIDISDKHIEVVVRQMTSKVRVEDGGDTTLLPGEPIDLYEIQQVNEAMSITGGAPAEYTPELLGITKASLKTDSFISAASFQETTRILTEAAIAGKSDWLRGLKENVIIGRLIPAGTGFNAYEEMGSPDLDLAYDGVGVLDEEDLRDVVLDDQLARRYDPEELEDRFSFGYGIVTPGKDAPPAILDDGDELIDDSFGVDGADDADDMDDDMDDEGDDDDDFED